MSHRILVVDDEQGIRAALGQLLEYEGYEVRAESNAPAGIATFAVLELAIERWADCAPGCATLVHLARPRDLDPALGPERAD